MNKLQKRKGFTLTELAVVIAVIAVLIAVLVPTFYSLLNKAQVSTDSQLTKTMNEAISIEEATSGIETPEDAITAALSVGYSVENLSAKSEGNIIVYDQESKNFVLINEGLTTVVYKSSSTTKTDYKTATTWLFLETTDSSIVTSTGTNEYTIDGDNSYILIGSGWAGAKITIKSASGIDTSQVTGSNASSTKVITTYVKAASQTSGSTNPVAAKSAVATSGSTSDYPILYNVKGAYLNYNGGEVAVKIFGSSYVSFSEDVKDNSNSIVVANTVSYVDVTAASGTIKVDVESGGATQIISDGTVTVTNTSGTQLSVTLVSSEYGSTTKEAEDVEELVTDSSHGVYSEESRVTKDPTCDESGFTTYVYVNNYTGDKITVIKDIKSANGHSYTIAWNWSDDHSTASVTYTCSECDENTANHTYTKDATVTSQTTEATCTEAGSTVYTATYDNISDTLTVVIPAKGHTSVTDEAVEVTESTNGKTEGSHCSVCGEVLVAQQEILTETAKLNNYLSGETPENIGEVIDILADKNVSVSSSETRAYKWDSKNNVIVLYDTVNNQVICSADKTYDANYLCNFSANLNEYSGFAYGDGTEDNPYQIATLAQLESLRTLISTGTNVIKAADYESNNTSVKTNSYVYIELVRDLVLGNTWIPLGSTAYEGNFNEGEGTSVSADRGFIGVFDGNNHTITMVNSIYNDAYSDYALFANVFYSGNSDQPTIIKNLTMEMNIEAKIYDDIYYPDEGDSYTVLNVDPWSCSAIAYYAVGDGVDSMLFENITVNGTITAGVVAAGVVTEAYGCTFKNCTNNADITTVSTNYANEYDYTTIGGICASASSFNNLNSTGYKMLLKKDLSVTFDNCENTGTLSFKYKCYDASNAETEYNWREYSDWDTIYNIGQIVGCINTPGTYDTSYGVDDLPIALTLTNCEANGNIIVYCHKNTAESYDWTNGDIYNFEGTIIYHNLDEEKWNNDNVIEYIVEDPITTYDVEANVNKELIGGNICVNTIIDGKEFTASYNDGSYGALESGSSN